STRTRRSSSRTSSGCPSLTTAVRKNDTTETEWHVSTSLTSLKKPSLGQKPVFLQPIASCTVPHGEVARFHAYVSGMPKPEMTWFHNRSPVKATKNVVFHFDAVTNIATLIIVDAFSDYKVMAINTEGSAESTASLLVSLREEQSANYLRSAKRSARYTIYGA
uniref:Immunoglobulin I-set domain-containing protein n=1 Tax=Neogobius melanostomus TaxID=47308 RepID=A0A8C6U5Z6_9GOBI